MTPNRLRRRHKREHRHRVYGPLLAHVSIDVHPRPSRPGTPYMHLLGGVTLLFRNFYLHARKGWRVNLH